MAYVSLRPKQQYWPQRVGSVTPHTLNFVRDGIILADLHKSLQIWGWFLPKKFDLPTQGGGRSGNFRGSKNQKSGKCHELSRKSINLFLPIPPGGRGVPGGGWGSKFQKSGKFHELSRKSIKQMYPPPTKGGRSGNFRGVKKSKVREMS